MKDNLREIDVERILILCSRICLCVFHEEVETPEKRTQILRVECKWENNIKIGNNKTDAYLTNGIYMHEVLWKVGNSFYEQFFRHTILVP